LFLSSMIRRSRTSTLFPYTTLFRSYIGLYEVATAFYGPDWEENKEAKDFTLEVIKTLKAKADELGEQYGYHFSVYSTPSESLTRSEEHTSELHSRFDLVCRLLLEKK